MIRSATPDDTKTICDLIRALAEDLFVKPEHRGKGHGKALLVAVARLAVERGCGRLEWSVLNWNEPSIAFYRSLGAVPMGEWKTYRLTGGALVTAAGQRRLGTG